LSLLFPLASPFWTKISLDYNYLLYGDAQIQKIIGANFQRVLTEIWGG
jgi:hypothetical protein